MTPPIPSSVYTEKTAAAHRLVGYIYQLRVTGELDKLYEGHLENIDRYLGDAYRPVPS